MDLDSLRETIMRQDGTIKVRVLTQDAIIYDIEQIRMDEDSGVLWLKVEEADE